MSHTNPIIRDKIIQCDYQTVWEHLTEPDHLRRLCERYLDAGVVFENTTNPYSASDDSVFAARHSGRDLLLTGRGRSIAMRVVQEDDHSRVVVAASGDDNVQAITKSQIDSFLEKLRAEVEHKAGVRQAFDVELSTTKKHIFSAADDAQSSRGDREEAGEAAMSTSDWISDQKALYQGRPRRRFWLIAGVALALLALLVGVIWFLNRDSGFPAPENNGNNASALVTVQNALTLQVGDSADEVARVLGTEGEAFGDAARLYRGTGAEGEIQILVRYGSAGAESITCIDRVRAAAVGSVVEPNQQEIAYDTTLAELEALMDGPASMIRSLSVGEEEITEMHFGYVDPFANFDPAWRGEIVIIQNKTAQTASVEYWNAYDGADPLMIGALEGSPASYQYDSYTDFLNDKFAFEKTFFMIQGYSTGDVEKYYGTYTYYSNEPGMVLHYQDAPELLADAQTPVYRRIFGFDSRGEFVMTTYTCLRLVDKQGMLTGSQYLEATRGMSYGEVRGLMQILPTAVLIDNNNYTLCYGQMLNSDVFEEQFEFMVRFDIETNYAQGLWDNTQRNTGNAGEIDAPGD